MDNETKYNQLCEKLSSMFPEMHRRLMPIVDQVVDAVTDIEAFNEEMLSAMAKQVIQNSNVIMTLSPMGQSAINDIAKILILNRLIDGVDDSFLPFVFFPARFRHRRRFRPRPR